MAVVAVVGAQWGDEGKGKIVDLLAKKASVVVRHGGGANAGHTLVLNGEKLVTHLVPSGVLHAGTKCVLGEGMVIDPAILAEEIKECQGRGLLGQGELLVGDGAHVIFPYHKIIEGLREDNRAQAIGTTRRGIGPCYESKAARRGIRIADLGRASRLRELIEENLEELRPLIAHYGGEVPSAAHSEEWIRQAQSAYEIFAGSVGNASAYVGEAVKRGDDVLLEGAQGALLDLDHGTYPFVTSSATIAGGAAQNTGLGPTQIDRVLGITKAYCTRVGGGPFPTEMNDEEAEAWRSAGAEFGATTGRPRRCGWLDVAALRRVVRQSGMKSLALTKLDILGGRGAVSVCVGYKKDGETTDEMPGNPEGWEPVFEELPGWDEDLAESRSLSDLPSNARRYVDQVQEWTGASMDIVSLGPDREQTIVASDLFT